MSTPYPKEPISPLRARMIEDMRIRNFALATQRGYIRAVKMLATFLRRSPDTATADDLRSFQRHLAATGITPGVLMRVDIVIACEQGHAFRRNSGLSERLMKRLGDDLEL